MLFVSFRLVLLCHKLDNAILSTYAGGSMDAAERLIATLRS